MSPLCCCQVELERLRKEEEAVLATQAKEQLGETVHALEKELAEKQVEVQTLQVRGHWITTSIRTLAPLKTSSGLASDFCLTES